MTTISHLFQTALNQVLLAFAHNWIFLLASIVISALVKLYFNQERVAAYVKRHQKGSVAIATLAAVGTPLCSCGTMAVVLGMMASMMPWAPIVAFMVASPLTSPEGLIYSAGLFGWPFALAFFIASIILGLAGGLVASLLESRGWLKNQARMGAAPTTQPLPVLNVTALQPAPMNTSCACSGTSANILNAMVLQPTPLSAYASAPNAESLRPAPKPRITLKMISQQLYQDGSRLLLMFFGFAFLGYLLNGLIPSAWITTLFGSGRVYGVPLAATFGLPFYINSEASLPLVRAMLDSGMSPGAGLAYLITGAGTSIGAIAGAMTIARWRVIAVVIGTLWVGAIAIGLVFDLLIVGGLI